MLFRSLYSFFGYTAGQDTFIDELIVAAGGTNVAAEEGIEEYQPLSQETVVDTDPDWIVLNSNSPEIPEGEGYEQTTAVQEEQVIIVDINHLNRPAPRVVYGVSAMAEAFHGDAYEEALEAAEDEEGTDDVEEDDQESIDADNGEESDEPDPSDTDDELSGFGVTVAALALSTLALLGRVRPDR